MGKRYSGSCRWTVPGPAVRTNPSRPRRKSRARPGADGCASEARPAPAGWPMRPGPPAPAALARHFKGHAGAVPVRLGPSRPYRSPRVSLWSMTSSRQCRCFREDMGASHIGPRRTCLIFQSQLRLSYISRVVARVVAEFVAESEKSACVSVETRPVSLWRHGLCLCGPTVAHHIVPYFRWVDAQGRAAGPRASV
jgi:hypothetical protein